MASGFHPMLQLFGGIFTRQLLLLEKSFLLTHLKTIFFNSAETVFVFHD